MARLPPNALPGGFPPTVPPFQLSESPQLIARYHDLNCSRTKADSSLEEVSQFIKRNGYLDEGSARVLGTWKYSAGLGAKIASNGANRLRLASEAALGASSAADALKPLLALFGVGVPTASAFLHLFHRDPFPLVDDYMLLALGIDTKTKPGSTYYNSVTRMTVVYSELVPAFRKWALTMPIDHRDLDRCLWVIGHDLRKQV